MMTQKEWDEVIYKPCPFCGYDAHNSKKGFFEIASHGHESDICSEKRKNIFNVFLICWECEVRSPVVYGSEIKEKLKNKCVQCSLEWEKFDSETGKSIINPEICEICEKYDIEQDGITREEFMEKIHLLMIEKWNKRMVEK